MATEKMECAVCRGKEIRPLFIKGEFTFLRCAKCDFQFVHPMPTSGELGFIYNEGTRAGSNHTINYDLYLRQGDTLKIEFRRILESMSDWGPPGKVLDVGCAAGFFLRFARDRGWEVFGSELSEDLAEYGRKTFGLSIASGDLAMTAYPEATFDVVTLIGVIEHLSDPNLVADELARVTKKGGVLIVLTENIDTLLPKLLKQRWNGYMPPEHVCYYSPRSLSVLLERRGFALKRVWGISSELRSSLGGLLGAGRFKSEFKTSLEAKESSHSIIYSGFGHLYRVMNAGFRLFPVHDRMICAFQRE